MKYSNRIKSYILCILLSAGILSACANSSDTENSENLADTNRSLHELSEKITQAPDTSGSTIITLSDKTAEVSGSGAEAADGIVKITAGGTYVVTGEISDGRIIVNAPDKEVTIVLENACISCSYGSPVYIYESKLTTIYLTENTKNTLTDGSEYTFSDSFSSAADEEPNACLYSKSDLVIAGSGQLIVNANYNNGITSKDTLTIESSSVNVTAKNNGINGKDFCVINNADINVTCEGDALRSTNDSDSTLGYIEISNSSLDLTAGEDGSINIIKSYEGIEGAAVDISGGTISVTASDDGINAAGGADQSGFGPRRDNFAGSSDYYINISGGIITVDAYGDGVDANGSITVSGGELYVSGSTNSGNGALDYDGTSAITGGIVVAAGSSGMAQNFSSNSTQGSILLTYPDSSAETISLKNESGDILASYSPSKNYNCVMISCPSVTTGNTYTVGACGQTTAVTMSSLIYGNSDGMGGGRFGKGNAGDQPREPGNMKPPGGQDKMREPGAVNKDI